MFPNKFAIFVLLMAGRAIAEPLADMEGTWTGSGWAREMPQGPKETMRCRIQNDYDDASLTLNVSGQCVVPGRRLDVSGTLVGTEDSDQITGRWSNPDGIGSTRIFGIQRDGLVAFHFSATDPFTGRDLAQNVEWRLTGDTLRLRSAERDDPDSMMSDISFRR